MLDRNRPYDEVWGDSPARYYQDGKHYTGSGLEVDELTGEVLEKEAEVVAITSDDYELLHWSALKKLVLASGGEWTDRAAGISFMRGIA